jgi:hypothetical protein
VQLAKLRIIKTQRAHELGWNFGFVRSTSRQDTDSDVLRTGRTLEHRPLAAQTEAIRRNQSCHDRLAKPPAGLDHDLVDAVERIPGKEDSRAIGDHQLLNDDPYPQLP